MPETHDGFQTLSEISGISKSDVKQIFEDVKANIAKLLACKRHRFTAGVRPAFGQKLTCQECGGTMGLMSAGEYIRGYEAAGGNADDVWPGYHGDKKTEG